MFKDSENYVTDSWVGRYFNSGRAATTHLAMGLALIAVLVTGQPLHIGRWGWLLAIVPGFWLFSMGIMFGFWAVAKLMGMKFQASLFVHSNGTWMGELCTREGAAFIISMCLQILLITRI